MPLYTSNANSLQFLFFLFLHIYIPYIPYTSHSRMKHRCYTPEMDKIIFSSFYFIILSLLLLLCREGHSLFVASNIGCKPYSDFDYIIET